MRNAAGGSLRFGRAGTAAGCAAHTPSTCAETASCVRRTRVADAPGVTLRMVVPPDALDGLSGTVPPDAVGGLSGTVPPDAVGGLSWTVPPDAVEGLSWTVPPDAVEGAAGFVLSMVVPAATSACELSSVVLFAAFACPFIGLVPGAVFA